MAKKDEDKVIPMYAPWTVIQGGKVDEEDEDEILLNSDDLIYIIASPTGLCGAFTKMELVEEYVNAHPNVQVFQVLKDTPIQ